MRLLRFFEKRERYRENPVKERGWNPCSCGQEGDQDPRTEKHLLPGPVENEKNYPETKKDRNDGVLHFQMTVRKKEAWPKGHKGS